MRPERQDELLKSLFRETAQMHDPKITEKVMQHIQEAPVSKRIAYEPPISATAWLIIGCALMLLLMYGFWMESELTITWPHVSINLAAYTDRFLSSFKVSLPRIPTLSLPLLATVLAFNVGGMYFILTAWWRQRTLKDHS